MAQQDVDELMQNQGVDPESVRNTDIADLAEAQDDVSEAELSGKQEE